MTRPTTGLGKGRQHPWVLTANFLSKIDQKPEGCWGWTGSVDPKSGYGRQGKGWAHRISYEMFVGPIPLGYEIDHVLALGCVERTCTRPDHLEAVPPAENRRRQPNVIAQLARTHCPHGHPYDELNTIRRRGKRECRECGRIRVRARKKKGFA